MQFAVENSQLELRSAAKEVASKPSDQLHVYILHLVLMASLCNNYSHVSCGSHRFEDR